MTNFFEYFLDLFFSLSMTWKDFRFLPTVGMTGDFGERGGKGGGASAAPFSPSTPFKNRSRVIPTIGRNLIHHRKFAAQIANENRNKIME